MSVYFMGIDTGTSETKGVLIDIDANIVAQSSCLLYTSDAADE